MKRIALLLSLMLVAAVCSKAYAQENSAGTTGEQTNSYALVEVKPKFQGGDLVNFTKWVFTQVKYPEQAKKENLSGRVTLQFTVCKDGSIKDVKVLRGVHPALDSEAVRVISSSPKWEPGMVKGEPVDVSFVFPIIFKTKKTIDESVASFDLDVTPAMFNPSNGDVSTLRSSSNEFTKWVFMNMEYPEEARQKWIQGNVKASFDILETGEITNIKIIESAHPLLDAELVRVLKMSPKWKAAMKNGKPVRTTYTFPFIFQLR